MSQTGSFNQFKVHTQYSICEGANKIDDLAEFCKNHKISSLGICDSYNLCGALEFSEKISKSGTQPIIGSQINFVIDGVIGKLPIFATNQESYKDLIRLSSNSYLNSDEKSEPHCSFDDLVKLNKNLIILSGNHQGLIGKLFKLNKIKQIEDVLKIINENFTKNF